MQKHSDIIHAKLNALIQTKAQRTLWLFLLMMIGYALRWQYFQGYYYNPDELIHLNITKGGSLASVWEYWRNETHPPLGHFIRYAWMQWGDVEDISYQRHLSIVFGLGCIPLMYLFGKELVNREVGIISAAILTYAHHAIMASAVVRNYSMGSLFLLAALIFFLRFYKKAKKKDALLFVIFSAATTATVYLTALTFFSVLFVWGIFELWQKNYKKCLILVILGIPAAIVCVGFYLFQIQDIAYYANMARALDADYLKETHYGSLILYSICCFTQAVMLIPNALGSYEFYWDTLDIGWFSDLLVSISLCCTAILLMFTTAKCLREKPEFILKRYCFSLVILIITLAVAIYVVSPEALGVPRRWFCFFVAIIPIFAFGCLRIKKYWAILVLIFPILISFWWNMSSIEMVVSEVSQNKIMTLPIAEKIGTNRYEIIAHSPTALMLMNQNENMYEDHLENLSRINPYSQIIFANTIVYSGLFGLQGQAAYDSIKKQFQEHLIRKRGQYSFVLFLLSRWYLVDEGLENDIIFCFPTLSGAKVLLKEPRNSRVNHTQYYMVALPYQTAHDFFVTQKIDCPRKQSLEEKEAIWNSIEVTP